MPEKKRNKLIKIIAGIVLSILMLFIIVVLVIRSPWGQDIIVSKALGFVAEKTGAKVDIRRLFVTFSGNAFLEGLYVEDQQGDTLVYSESLEISVALMPLIKGDGLNLKMLEWSGLTARVNRRESSGAYNFDFLIAAFAAEPDSTNAATEAPQEQNSFTIEVGSITFKDFDIAYDDEVGGMLALLKIGSLELKMDDFDLDQMKFHVESFALDQSAVTYKQYQTASSPEDTTAAASPLPLLIVDEIALENVSFLYESAPDSLLVFADVGHLLAEMPELNLEENIVDVASFTFNNSEIAYTSGRHLQAAAPLPDTTVSKPSLVTFEWPDWQVAVGSITLENNQVTYQADTVRPGKGIFNPNAMAITDLSLEASDVALHPGLAHIQVGGFTFREASGLQLDQLAFDLKVEDKNLLLSDLELSTGKSSIKANLKLSYPSIAGALNEPERVAAEVDISELQVDVSDAFVFAPALKDNSHLLALSKKVVNGRVRAVGALDDFNVEDAFIAWGEGTSLTWSGSLKHALQPDHLQFEARPLLIKSQKSDILHFVDEEALGIALPETITLRAEAKGDNDGSTLLATLTIPEGEVTIDGKFTNKDQLAFNAHIDVNQLQLNKLLKNEQLGTLTFEATASGSGTALATLSASLQSDFKTLEFNHYDFSGLTLAGDMKNGQGDVTLSFKDENLDVSMKTLLQLDTASSTVGLTMDLKGADFRALGITSKDLRARFKLQADFEGNADFFTVKADIKDGLTVYEGESFPLGSFKADASVQEDTTTLNISSRSLNLDLRSNTPPASLATALTRQFTRYFPDSVAADTVLRAASMKLILTVRESPFLNEVMLDGLERLDSVTLRVEFDEALQTVSARLRAPFVQYNGNTIDSLRMDVQGARDSLTFEFGWAGVKAGPLAVEKTTFAGVLQDRLLLLDFTSLNQEATLAYIQSEIRMEKGAITYHLVPAGLILDKQSWEIPETNQIRYSDKLMVFEDFTFSKGNQSLTVSSSLADTKEQHIGILFQEFSLATLLSALNPNQQLATGVLAGKLIIENPFRDAGILANLNIDQLEVMKVALGKMVVNAKSIGPGSYDFNMNLNGDNADLDLTGDYVAAEEGAKVNLGLNLNSISMKAVEGFVPDAVSDASGKISGKVKITGTTASPEYAGKLNFAAASLKVNSLNTQFTLPNEALTVDNAGLYMDNFTIIDNDENAFRLDGKVLTESLINPTFDFTVKAKNFQPVNASKNDNELFYGKVKMDADLAVSGDLKVPVVKGKLTIREGTDFTFVVPESQVDIMEREGVLLFVNKENPDDILTRGDDKAAAAQLVGYDVNTNLSVEKNAVFRIIIDEKTGDNFQVSGTGDLIVGLEPNGRTTLSGTYSINSGHYETNLYNLVKKRFEISPQSTITWRGDPLDALLNVRAIYKVETSAAPLMAIRTSGESTTLANKYQQKLPFLVYLNVDGQLLQPELSFALDMPEDEKGAIGGDVYGRLQQLNNQESELNKQVFSLLVLNRFFPGSGSDGSGGGAVSVARGNVNKVLSGQLNNFSDKLVGKTGLDLNFGLDSYTDYQGESPQDRTQLDINAQKKLFNDRLIVQVGSAVNIEGSSQTTEGTTPVIGNVSLEYLLSENGQYRLKGFRKNEFESVIDGQLIVTGIAFLYNKEFNKFRELWQKIAKDEGLEKEIEEENAEKK
jgi:translocation and assembly module TamB